MYQIMLVEDEALVRECDCVVLAVKPAYAGDGAEHELGKIRLCAPARL